MNSEYGNEAVSVAITDSSSSVIYNSLLRPNGRHIKFSGTHILGLTVREVKMAPSRESELIRIHRILKQCLIIGHSIEGDLKSIGLSDAFVYDLSKCPHIRHRLCAGSHVEFWNERKVSLKQMSSSLLGLDIQGGAHTAIEDSLATMEIFKWLSAECM